MILKHDASPTLFMRIGLVSLIFATLSARFLQRIAQTNAGWVDGTTGFFYGVAIAAMLISVALRSRRR